MKLALKRIVAIGNCLAALLLWFTPAYPVFAESSSTPQQTQEFFDTLLEEDFIGSACADTLTLHSTLRNPENYGITDHTVSWGDLGVTFTPQDIKSDLQWIRAFRSINRAHLTDAQKQSYDVMEYQISMYREGIDTYYYYDPFSSSNGYHTMLPIIMGEYAFFSAADVEDYLILLGTIDELYDSLIALEYERVDRGLFMTDTAADEVIQSCRDYLANRQDNVLIRTFEQRVDVLAGAGEAQKEAWKATNRELFDTVVVPAYENLIAEIEGMKGSGVNEMGLAHFPLGREYYIYRLRSMGISRSPKEIIRLLNEQVEEYNIQLMSLNAGDFSALDNYGNLTPVRTAEEIMETLKEACKSDFPSIPEDVRYTLYTIDESIKDYVAPAFYFVPRLDDYAFNSIYYNADYFDVDRDYMFFVFAHEGYPGHLLQNVTVMSSDLPNWRKNVDFTAYSEGWANYVEYYAYRYLDVPNEISEASRILDEMEYLMMLRLDLGIHYEGWSIDDMAAYFETKSPFPFYYPESAYSSVYDFILGAPMNSVPYIVGMFEVRALAARYEEKLGSDYSDMWFHTEYLKYGEAPFALLRKWMDASLLQSEHQDQAA